MKFHNPDVRSNFLSNVLKMVVRARVLLGRREFDYYEPDDRVMFYLR